ncbi:hypothetical protein MRB53_039375 [Persea americana]|nr:hypothetical protein MRB53_039375 [Persea americana]
MLGCLLARTSRSAIRDGCQARSTFHVLASLNEKALPPRRKITDDEIEEAFLKGSGPGGQKINKTSSAVQLKHIPTGIVVKSQHTRSREQNRKYARQLLGEKLDEMENGDMSRTAIKNERASQKKARAKKKSRQKYRKLDEEKAKLQDGEAKSEVDHESEQDGQSMLEEQASDERIQETRQDR